MDSRKVLILNQTFEPLQICTARRAVVLLFAGKAERIEDNPQLIRSPSVAIHLPSVIRLHHFIKPPAAPMLSFNKKNILKRDAYTCQYCGRNGGERMTIDHIIPRSLGGRTVWENVVSACRACNLKKGNKTLGDTGMRLLRKPTRPRSASYLGILAYASHHYERWRKYLPPEADPARGESVSVPASSHPLKAR
jgi:5-methylcytosine-specific restriction endonuclease McrA